MHQNCSNGSFSNRVSNSLASTTSLYCNLLQNADTTYIYLSMEKFGTTTGTLCRHILGYSNFLCLDIAGSSLARTVSYITADEIYSTSLDNINTNMWMQRTNFVTSAIIWIKSYSCSTSGSCAMGNSRSLISSDQSKIYTMSPFGISGAAYPMFLTLNAVNGVPISTTYKILIDCSDIYSMEMKSNDIFSIGLCSSLSYLFQINTVDNSVKYYKTSSQIKLYNLNFYPNTNRLFIVGSNSGSEWYIVQLPINAIDQHPDFSNATLLYSTENSVSKVSDASGLTSVTSNSGDTPGIGGSQLTPTPSVISNSSASFTSLVSYHLVPIIQKIIKSIFK